MTVKLEPRQVWSPGLASGDWSGGVVSEEERGMEDPGELGTETLSLVLCSLPPVPPEVTVSCHHAPEDSTTCLAQPFDFALASSCFTKRTRC